MSEFPKTEISPALVAAIAQAVEESSRIMAQNALRMGTFTQSPGVTADEMRAMLSTLTQGQGAGEQFKDWLVNLAREPLPADIVERAKQAIEDLNDARLADDLLAQWQQGDIAAHPWSEVRKGLEEE